MTDIVERIECGLDIPPNLILEEIKSLRQQLDVASYWGPRWEKEHAENKALRQQLDQTIEECAKKLNIQGKQLAECQVSKQQGEPVAWYSHCTDPAQIHPEWHGRLCFYGATCPDDYPTPIRFTDRDNYEWRPLFTAPPNLDTLKRQWQREALVNIAVAVKEMGVFNYSVESIAEEIHNRAKELE
jgi:hypothetical protein